MMKLLTALTILIRTVVQGDDYCNPDVDKEWTDLELQTWDGMNKNEFYLFPDYAQNAVLRIKKFGNNRCSKNEVRIFPTEDSTGQTPNWITIHAFHFDEIVITVNPNEEEFEKLFGKNHDGRGVQYTVRVNHDCGQIDFSITFKMPSFQIVKRSNEYFVKELTPGHGVDSVRVVATTEDGKWEHDSRLLSDHKKVVGGYEIPKEARFTQYYLVEHSKVSVEEGKVLWKQHADRVLVPLRWTQSGNNYYRNPEDGSNVKFTHYDQSQQTKDSGQQPLTFMAGHWHVIEYQVAGLPMDRLKRIEAQKFWISSSDGEAESVDCTAAIVMSGMTCGGDKNVEESVAKTCHGKLSGKHEGNKVKEGFIKLKAVYEEDSREHEVSNWVPFTMAQKGDEAHKNIVYVTQKPLGSDKLKGSAEWPLVTDSNEYKFGSNLAFVDTKNVNEIQTIQGTTLGYQIQCTGKCGKHNEWEMRVGGMCTDRKAKSASKFAADCPGDFYVLMQVEDNKEGESKSKQDRPIKTAMVIASPMKVEGRLDFKVRAVAKPSDHLLVIPVNVTKWDGAAKFWGGLIALVVIVVLQVLSCVYMAKRNAKAANKLEVMENVVNPVQATTTEEEEKN